MCNTYASMSAHHLISLEQWCHHFPWKNVTGCTLRCQWQPCPRNRTSKNFGSCVCSSLTEGRNALGQIPFIPWNTYDDHYVLEYIVHSFFSKILKAQRSWHVNSRVLCFGGLVAEVGRRILVNNYGNSFPGKKHNDSCCRVWEIDQFEKKQCQKPLASIVSSLKPLQ